MVTNTFSTQNSSAANFARRDPFQAIADPHRRAIISLLAEKKHTLNEVASKFTISRPAVSKHVKILNECGLVEFIDQGRERFCVLKAEPLQEVSGWIDQYRKFWEDRLDALELYLAELQAKEQEAVKKPAGRKGKK
jgi:DNA-binding transcriptional ArsR family regulator